MPLGTLTQPWSTPSIAVAPVQGAFMWNAFAYGLTLIYINTLFALIKKISNSRKHQTEVSCLRQHVKAAVPLLPPESEEEGGSDWLIPLMRGRGLLLSPGTRLVWAAEGGLIFTTHIDCHTRTISARETGQTCTVSECTFIYIYIFCFNNLQQIYNRPDIAW